jgi:hypothetical protein
MTVLPNPAGAVDAPIACLFAGVRHRRRATDRHRWPEECASVCEELDDSIK